jgi:hypothetical protein
MRVCTDCLVFHSRSGCVKNCEEWRRAKEVYPVTLKEASLQHHPMTTNEKQRLNVINAVARKCEEFKQDPRMEES